MLRIIFLFLLACFPVYIATAQNNNIKARAHVTFDAVYLRWIPAGKQTFDNSLKYGYKIERAIVPDSSAINSSSLNFNKLLTVGPLKPLAQNDSAWITLMSTEKGTGFIYNTLYSKTKTVYPGPEEKKKAEEMNFGLFLLSCDLSAGLASAAGLFIKDSVINSNEKYIYRISFYDPPAQIKNPVEKIFVDASVIAPLPSIKNLTGKFSDRKVELTWNVSENKNNYAAYIIERSDDSVNFSRVNRAPFVQLQSNYEKRKNDATYNDSLPENGKYYYYRIKGLTHFGIMGPAGNIIKGKGKNLLAAYALFDTVYTINNKTVHLKWKMPQDFDQATLKGYAIARAETDNGKYIIINNKIIPPAANFYTDSVPGFTNYYKILAINNDLDTSYSFSWLVQLTDNDAPLAPSGLYGAVDTAGIVTLNWNKNKEPDMKGYRVFRCNSLNEEFVERTKIIVSDTMFRDTVVIKTLSENVFYSITAVDSFYNNSGYSSPVKVKRPDIIPPVAPLLKQLIITDSSVFLQWINSSSDDVIKYMLARMEISSGKEDTLISFLIIDTISTFNDRNVLFGKTYKYIITAFDDSNNSSSAISNAVAFEPGVRPAIADIKSNIDYDKRTIKLIWNYDYTDIYSYTIYKSRKGESLRIYRTIKATDNLLEDKEVKVNNTYVYKIKAIFNSGAESILSDAIEIKY